MIWKIAPHPQRAIPLFYAIEDRTSQLDIAVHLPNSDVQIHAPLSAFDKDIQLTPDDEYLEWHASVLRVALALRRFELAKKHIDHVLYSANRRFGRLLLLVAKYCGRHSDLVHAYGLMVHTSVLLCPNRSFRKALQQILIDTESNSDESRTPSDLIIQTLEATATIISPCTEMLRCENRVVDTVKTNDVNDDCIEQMLVSTHSVPSLKFWKVIDPCAEYSAVVREWVRGPFLQTEWVPSDAARD